MAQKYEINNIYIYQFNTARWFMQLLSYFGEYVRRYLSPQKTSTCKSYIFYVFKVTLTLRYRLTLYGV